MTALMIGVNYQDYWNYSNREIKIIFDAYAEGQKKMMKQTVQNYYSLAQMTASFVGIAFSDKKKKIPTVYELYPDLFEKEARQAKWQKQKSAMLAIAQAHNMRGEK